MAISNLTNFTYLRSSGCGGASKANFAGSSAFGKLALAKNGHFGSIHQPRNLKKNGRVKDIQTIRVLGSGVLAANPGPPMIANATKLKKKMKKTINAIYPQIGDSGLQRLSTANPVPPKLHRQSSFYSNKEIIENFSKKIFLTSQARPGKTKPSKPVHSCKSVRSDVDQASVAIRGNSVDQKLKKFSSKKKPKLKKTSSQKLRVNHSRDNYASFGDQCLALGQKTQSKRLGKSPPNFLSVGSIHLFKDLKRRRKLSKGSAKVKEMLESHQKRREGSKNGYQKIGQKNTKNRRASNSTQKNNSNDHNLRVVRNDKRELIKKIKSSKNRKKFGSHLLVSLKDKQELTGDARKVVKPSLVGSGKPGNSDSFVFQNYQNSGLNIFNKIPLHIKLKENKRKLRREAQTDSGLLRAQNMANYSVSKKGDFEGLETAFARKMSAGKEDGVSGTLKRSKVSEITIQNFKKGSKGHTKSGGDLHSKPKHKKRRSTHRAGKQHSGSYANIQISGKISQMKNSKKSSNHKKGGSTGNKRGHKGNTKKRGSAKRSTDHSKAVNQAKITKKCSKQFNRKLEIVKAHLASLKHKEHSHGPNASQIRLKASKKSEKINDFTRKVLMKRFNKKTKKGSISLLDSIVSAQKQETGQQYAQNIQKKSKNQNQEVIPVARLSELCASESAEETPEGVIKTVKIRQKARGLDYPSHKKFGIFKGSTAETALNVNAGAAGELSGGVLGPLGAGEVTKFQHQQSPVMIKKKCKKGKNRLRFNSSRSNDASEALFQSKSKQKSRLLKSASLELRSDLCSVIIHSSLEFQHRGSEKESQGVQKTKKIKKGQKMRKSKKRIDLMKEPVLAPQDVYNLTEKDLIIDQDTLKTTETLDDPRLAHKSSKDILMPFRPKSSSEHPIHSANHAQTQENTSKMDEHCFQLLQEESQNPLKIRKIEQKQTEIKWGMRAILFDWICEVCYDFDITRETFHYAVNYVDRCLENLVGIKKQDFQLVGVTCLMMACKMEEVIPPSVEHLACVGAGVFDEGDILRKELEISMVQN